VLRYGLTSAAGGQGKGKVLRRLNRRRQRSPYNKCKLKYSDASKLKKVKGGAPPFTFWGKNSYISTFRY
jgi:hypothetical protein